MASVTFETTSANNNARSHNVAGFGVALRNFFAGFGGFATDDALRTAAQLGPEQLKEIGAVQDLHTGLVYGR